MKQNTQTKNAEPVEGFTGGEWSLQQLEHNDEINLISTGPQEWLNGEIGDDHLIELRPLNTTDFKANAALIAESKNMYDALKEWLKVINRSNAALYHYGDAIKNTEAILNRINNNNHGN